MALPLRALRRLARPLHPAGLVGVRYASSAEIPLRYPTLQEADALCRNIREVSNETLATLAYLGCPDASRERLIREVMRSDRVDWMAAEKKVQEMSEVNHKWTFLFHVPHLTGVFLGITGAFISIPLVFHKSTAVWFNDRFVTFEEPEWEKIDTFLEIGSWTWAWMEPVMGTASFFLLGLQFARSNMQNMQLKPYTQAVKGMKANRLARLYPQYESHVVKAFSRDDTWRLLR